MTGEHPVTGELYTVQGWWTERADGQNLAGEGDSGGPVWNNHPDGTGTALGLIVAVDVSDSSLAPCTGRPVGRECSSVIFISDITRIAAARDLDVTR